MEKTGHRRIPVNLSEQRKIALMFIATGSIFTGVASILGMLMILDSSIKTPPITAALFSVHPLLQIFGFLAEFVLGVSYSLIPSFKSHGLPSYRMAYATFGMITGANGGFMVSLWLPLPAATSQILLIASLFAELVAAFIYLWQIGFVLARGRKSSLEGDSYILLSPISLSLALVALIYSFLSGTDPYGMGELYLALIGFVGSMIFGVTMKTVAVRFTTNKSYTYRYGTYAQAAGIASAFLEVFLQIQVISYVTAIVFLISVSLFVLSARTMSQSRLLMPGPDRAYAHKGPTRGHRNLLYLELSFMAASAWLIAGVFFSILYSISGDFWIRIAFIHSFSIGFIGSTIIGIAPVLLPGILSRNVPSGNSSFAPLLLLNAGLAIFVSGDIAALNSAYLPYWAAVGGPVIVAAMLYFIYEIHRDLISRSRKSPENLSFSDDW